MFVYEQKKISIKSNINCRDNYLINTNTHIVTIVSILLAVKSIILVVVLLWHRWNVLNIWQYNKSLIRF